MHSEAFPDTGLYLLQAGAAASPDRLSVTLDAGPLGYGVLAAHGHADALAVTLRIGGHDVLVDPGTYDYFTHPEWRTYFRGTPAHNTVTIDDANQSEMLGPFLWGRRGGGEVYGVVAHRRRRQLPRDPRRISTVTGPGSPRARNNRYRSRG